MFIIEAACGCNKGRVRSNNEDNFYFDGKFLDAVNNGLDAPLKFERPLNDTLSLLVFDGMGGENFGEDASYAAACEMNNFELSRQTDFIPGKATLVELCDRINTAVVKSAREHLTKRMGSTLVGLFFSERSVYACNLGDSRAYRMQRGILQQLSQDHVDSRPRKSGKAPLTQHLGIDPMDMVIEPSIAGAELKEGDCFLICSDGVTDMLDDRKIAEILSQTGTAEECVNLLIASALENGGRDNITAIVVRVKADRKPDTADVKEKRMGFYGLKRFFIPIAALAVLGICAVVFINPKSRDADIKEPVLTEESIIDHIEAQNDTASASFPEENEVPATELSVQDDELPANEAGLDYDMPAQDIRINFPGHKLRLRNPKTMYVNAEEEAGMALYPDVMDNGPVLAFMQNKSEVSVVAIQGDYSFVDAGDNVVGWCDSNQLDSIQQQEESELTDVYIGGSVFLGHYEPDKDTANGKESIEWIVLSIEDGAALLLSKVCFDCKCSDEDLTEGTEEYRDILKWLNNEFYLEAFNAEERERIVPAAQHGNEDMGVMIYCLTEDELAAYLPLSEAEPSETSGLLIRGENMTDAQLSVRPALWIKIDGQ